jgi:protein-S-isoprenylcysteine O-methyltransferase Ste14
MDEKDDIDLLDRQLREAAPYIDDDGFTRRVLQQLPARRPRSQLFRAIILLSITLLASILTYFLSDGGRFVTDGIMRMAGMSPVMILAIGAIAGVFVMVAGMASAISKTRELRS